MKQLALVLVLSLGAALPARAKVKITPGPEQIAIEIDGKPFTVFYVGGKDLNRSQVEAGWAIAYGDYETEQAVARAGKAGIWAGTFDQPQDWRESHHEGPAERRHGTLASLGDALREFFRFR